MPPNQNFCIITSASNKFFPSLLNLLGSIKTNYPQHPDIYVYDLGLSFTFKKELELLPWVHLVNVPHFVPHWRACYTWKTYILNTPIKELNFYIDAGCQILRPLDELFRKIDSQGYLAVSQGPEVHIADITPNEYFKAFSVKPEYAQEEGITAGIFGFKQNSIVTAVTEKLYQAGVNKFCLGFSQKELWKNTGINKTEYVRDCEKFRHDTTLISILLRNEIPDLTVEPLGKFSSFSENDGQQFIFNFRMNYKKLDFIDKNILYGNVFNPYLYINRIYLQAFFILKIISNRIKSMKNKEILNVIFGMNYMDVLHPYPSLTSNIRYYHRLKARIIKKFIEKNAASDKSFLDAGAGRGPYCVLASPLFGKVYCDEFDANELEVAREYITTQGLINVSFLNNSLTKTLYADNSIDVAVCSEVLEHIPEREKAVAELYRILKPGGKLLISMPQKNSIFYKHVERLHKNYLAQPEPTDTTTNLWHFKQHVKFSAHDIENLATTAGFKILRRDGANVLPLGERVFSILYKVRPLLTIYIWKEFLLEKLFPKAASFYFIEVTK